MPKKNMRDMIQPAVAEVMMEHIGKMIDERTPSELITGWDGNRDVSNPELVMMTVELTFTVPMAQFQKMLSEAAKAELG